MSVRSSPGAAPPLKDLSGEQYSRLSELLDRSLEMAPAERDVWLAELERSDPQSSAVLRDLFASANSAQAHRFLEALGPLTHHLASIADAESGLIGRQFGPYRVLSLLGQGGMGSVWLAERTDGLFARQIALKLIHPALTGRLMTERLAREREILAGLSHPHIVQLLDAGVSEDGQPYLALEYVGGTPLTAYCDDRRLSVRARLELLQQVLSAVQYAHTHLVIHRDLKPSNILVTPEGQAQILDFGIAKLLTGGEAKETLLTQFGGRALTPDYAAPEQITGAPITTTADVYALGVILFEILTGERPYRLKRPSPGALEEAILRAEPLAPSRVSLTETAAAARATTANGLMKLLRGDLDAIAIKALQKSPSERYATANAFGEDIARFLRGDVVLAQRDTFAYRAVKFTRRHWIAMAAACTLILTLGGGLAATTYEAKVASAQRDAALQAQLRLQTEAAGARLKEGDAPAALGIILEVLPHRGVKRGYTPEALSVFQEARAADAAALIFTGHTDRVRTAEFSPDGRRAVTASYDKTARIWDAATGRQILQLNGHNDWVSSAAFSPDGRRVVTASSDKTARIWDATTGRETLLLSGHTDRVRTAEFSPDGRRIVTASFDKTARIWDAATGRELLLLSGHTDRLRGATFSPDGQRVVTVSLDKTARIWNASSGQQMVLLSGHAASVEAAAFSPDGGRVVTGAADLTARIWEVATGRELRVLSGHTDGVAGVAFSPDGRWIVTASMDKTARIWDVATGRGIRVLSGHTDFVLTAAFSPDGRRVITGSYDNTARIWDAIPEQEILRLTGHAYTVSTATFSPDGRRAVTGSFDKTARIWDAATGREILTLNGHTDWVTSAAFSPDGARIVTSSNDKTARIWDAATGREILSLNGHTGYVPSTAFSPDGRRVVTGSYDKTARIWDAATGRAILLLSGHTDWLTSAAFSPDGQRVVTASFDKTARIWDAATGRQTQLLIGHANAVRAAAFSPDGQRIVTASKDKTARIWDATTGQQLLLLNGGTDNVTSAVFTPDGRRVVTGSDDDLARIWDASTGQLLLALPGSVSSVAFSPDGRRLITGSDEQAAIWDARAPALDVQTVWAAAAQFAPLAREQRIQLGLPAQTEVRQWPLTRTKCDDSAAAPYDPDRRAPGVMSGQILLDIAIPGCADKSDGSGRTARVVYQRGRAMMASGNFTAARREFEQALAAGYRTAPVDLAMLLSQSSAGMLDAPRAISLYQQAWDRGVTVAAFELGSLYEHGISRAGSGTERLLDPDPSRAWVWYQKAADAADPDALARFAETNATAALSAENTGKRNAYLLKAFEFYAAAAERARIEDWPDESWRNWRYQRASIARLLAREEMMPAVAHVYDDVRRRYAPHPTLWERVTSSFSSMR